MKHRLQTFLRHKLQWLVLLTALLGVSQGVWANYDVTVTVYRKSGSCTPYIYAWSDDSGTTEFTGSWPGAVTSGSNKVYTKTFTVTKTNYKFIVSNNGFNQGSNLGPFNSSHTSVSCLYDCSGNAMVPVVAGSSGLCGSDWSNTACLMYYSDSKFSRTFTNISKGTYEFKVTNYNTWNTVGYSSGTNTKSSGVTIDTSVGSGNNIKFTTNSTKDITIYYDGTDAYVTATTPCSAPATPSTVSLYSLSPAASSGSGTSVDPYMVKKSTNYTFSIASTFSDSPTGFIATVNDATVGNGTSATSGNRASITKSSPTSYNSGATSYVLRSWAYKTSTSCTSESAASYTVYLKTCAAAPSGTAQADGTSTSKSITNGSSVTISLYNPSSVSSVTWKYSTDGGSTWSDISETPSGADYHFTTSPLTQVTKYKAIMSNACGDTAESIVTVNTSTVIYALLSSTLAGSWTNTIKVYGWNSSSSPVLGDWPGTAMESLGGNYYTYNTDLTTLYQIIINNDGDGSNQSADASITVGSKNCYRVSSNPVSGSDSRKQISKNASYCPSEFTSVTIDATASVCVGSTVTPSKSSDPSSDVSWNFSSSNTGVATVSSSGVVTGKAAGTATITATASKSGYISKSATCTVTVNAKPSAGTISGSEEACSGVRGGVNLKLNSYTSSGTSIKWQKYNGSSWTDFSPAATTDTLYRRQTSETDYRAVVTNTSTTCSSTTDAFTVGMKDPMALTSITLAPEHICPSGTSTVTPNGLVLSGGSISYSSGTTSKATVAKDLEGNTATITGVAVGSSVITATVSGGCGSIVTETATINVVAAPTVLELTNPRGEYTMCSNGSITLKIAGTQSGYTYQLYQNGVKFGNPVSGGGDKTFEVNQSGIYTAKAYYGSSESSCLTDMDGTITLNISTTPILVRSTPSVTNYAPVTITSINSDIYKWQVKDNDGNVVCDTDPDNLVPGTTAYLYDQTATSVTFKGASSGSVYEITATTKAGCPSEPAEIEVNNDTPCN